MNLICTILAGIRCLLERVTEWAGRRKVSKRSRRDKAVYVIGAIAVAAVAFSCSSVHAHGKSKNEASQDKESQNEDSGSSEEEIYGLGSIIQGVLTGHEAQSESTKVGTSFEVVLVGQRVSKKGLDSHLDFGEEGSENLNLLKEESLGLSESHLSMSDQDYETLLKIVEAEAGGEDDIGKILVANVIIKRVLDDRFPDTVQEVVYQPSQFQPVSTGKIHSVTATAETAACVDRALAGEDYSNGALYFMNRRGAGGRASWFDSQLTYLFAHDGHEFFK